MQEETLSPNSRLLRTPEAARQLGLSENYLAKLRIYGGGPPFSKIGAAVRYRQGDLEAFAAARIRTSTSACGIAIAA